MRHVEVMSALHSQHGESQRYWEQRQAHRPRVQPPEQILVPELQGQGLFYSFAQSVNTQPQDRIYLLTMQLAAQRVVHG